MVDDQLPEKQTVTTTPEEAYIAAVEATAEGIIQKEPVITGIDYAQALMRYQTGNGSVHDLEVIAGMDAYRQLIYAEAYVVHRYTESGEIDPVHSVLDSLEKAQVESRHVVKPDRAPIVSKAYEMVFSKITESAEGQRIISENTLSSMGHRRQTVELIRSLRRVLLEVTPAIQGKNYEPGFDMKGLEIRGT